MQARLNISGLCITHSWAQDITQVQDTAECVQCKSGGGECKAKFILCLQQRVSTSRIREPCGSAPTGTKVDRN